ncbi:MULTISPECIES: asparagine synthetase B family protein [unclassified Clostridium]|uniref:asparagine synthetase B family protein n=1 Tax=unclassified Clostridium TaxID=2614128 RepID=UPI001DF2D8DA|nr:MULTISPECIES: asparagine synthetase B family protein [unclassified Clostridium]MBN1044491.1 asparagine synthetase B family protein [Clostridium botulinum]
MSILLINQYKNNEILLRTAQNCEYRYMNYYSDEINFDYINDGILFNQKELIYNKNKTILGFMLGEIYDIDNKSLNSLDIENIISIYEKFGVSALKNLNGKFIICIHDQNTNETIILNDRYGYFTYYYCVEQDKYSFCNDPNILLKYIKKKQINMDSVKQFFEFGYMLNNSTLISNIKKMDPGNIIIIKDKKVKFEKYWKWTDVQKNYKITYEEAIEKCGILWIKSVKKILSKHEKFVLPLSGGLDSRAILAAIDYLGLNKKIYTAYTIGNEKCWDYLIAKEVCKKANIKHKLFHFNESEFLTNDVESIKNDLGSVYCIVSLPQKAKYLTKYPFLDGFAGDAVLGGSLLNKECINNIEMYEEHCKKYLGSSGIVDKSVIKNIGSFELELKKYSDYNSYDYFFLNNSRVRNFTMSGTLQNGTSFNNIFPFFDNALIDFIYSLPHEWRVNSKLYKDMLVKFFPKFYIDIPWQKTGIAIKKMDIGKKIILNNRRIKKYYKNIFLEKSDKKIVLFGASNLGKKAMKILKYKYNNILFCDNDSTKWEKTIEGIKVISPANMYKQKSDIDFIFITSMYGFEIIKQLRANGIRKIKIFNNLIRINENKEFQKINCAIKKNKEKIYDVFNSEIVKKQNILDHKNLMILLENNLNYNLNNWKDIMLAYTFIRFYQVYFEVSTKIINDNK